MARRSVRRRRRIEELNKHTPADTGPAECAAEDCSETPTTTVDIDGERFEVCDTHAELVLLQTQRRAAHRRQQEEAESPERRRQTEEALGLR